MATHNLRRTLACCQRASWRQPTTLKASLRCRRARPCKQQINASGVDGPMAVVRNAEPVAVTSAELPEIKSTGLWRSSPRAVARQLLESKYLWTSARSTTTMIAISSYDPTVGRESCLFSVQDRLPLLLGLWPPSLWGCSSQSRWACGRRLQCWACRHHP